MYRAAIATSGTSIVGWAYQRKHREIAFNLAKQFNSSVNVSEDVLQTLQNVSARELKAASFQLTDDLVGRFTKYYHLTWWVHCQILIL